jgi:hypothetical protein
VPFRHALGRTFAKGPVLVAWQRASPSQLSGDRARADVAHWLHPDHTQMTSIYIVPLPRRRRATDYCLSLLAPLCGLLWVVYERGSWSFRLACVCVRVCVVSCCFVLLASCWLRAFWLGLLVLMPVLPA